MESTYSVILEKSSLWTCPKCGAKFKTPNKLHSCGSWTVNQFLEGKSPIALALFDKFIEMARKCGPILVTPLKTRITIMVRIRFAAIQRLNDKGMVVSFWLKKKIENKRFQRVDFLPPNNWLYTLRIQSLEELDDEVQGWLKDSYRYGEQ